MAMTRTERELASILAGSGCDLTCYDTCFVVLYEAGVRPREIPDDFRSIVERAHDQRDVSEPTLPPPEARV